MSAPEIPATVPVGPAGLAVEQNGINVISESERKGTPRDLFWPWFAANVSVLGAAYGAYLLGFGVSFWQALVAGVVGIVGSFLLVGLAATSGLKANAPTMIVSRAAFGVRGNALPSALSYLALVGWEIILVALATLASNTVLTTLGWSGGETTKVVAFLLVVTVVVLAGVIGFDVIMKLQTWLTVALAILTVGYLVLTAHRIHFSTVSGIAGGTAAQWIGATVFAVTGFGLGWVNTAGDYARYLPRTASSSAVVRWTTIGAAVAPIVLVLDGLLLSGSDPELAKAIGVDPVGALATVLPLWYLLPFAVVAIGGLIGGAVLDIYSSGLTLLTLGLRLPRWQAAAIDGVLMIAGTIYVVWIADDFFGPFMGFLITLGVPLAAWCGIFLADLWRRRGVFDEAALFDASGRYGSVRWPAIAALVIATLVGWGLVTNTYAEWLSWQGYLLGPLGLGGRTGDWAFANLGVLVALLLGAGLYLVAPDRPGADEATWALTAVEADGESH